MKGEIEVAQKSAKAVGEVKEVFDSTLEEIDRMTSIVTNLLDLARADLDKGASATTEVALDQVVIDRFNHAARLAKDVGVELTLGPVSPVILSGNTVRLGQVVSNLIDNSIKYTQKGGRVAVTLESDDRQAVLKIADTGVGISSEDIPFLFDRFYRVDKARTREAGGAGLGLSICREIVEAHGGSIGVESEPGKGSVFTVSLPVEKEGLL